MRTSTTKTIDGVTVTVQQLPGMRGVRMLHRLTKAVGPALAASLVGFKSVKSLKDLGNADVGAIVGGLGDAVQKLFDNLTEAELEQLITDLLEGALVELEGQTIPLTRPIFDKVMTGRAHVALGFTVFAIEVNYGNFTDVVRKFSAPFLAEMKSKASESKPPAKS